MKMLFKQIRRILSFVFFIICGIFFSCETDDFYLDQNVKLDFSSDTLTFDTALNGYLSPVKKLMVYNPYNKKVLISNIVLRNDKTSTFIINIDGAPTSELKNRELYPKDSMYVFIQYIAANGSESLPKYVESYLDFTVNSNLQTVVINAWGQDVVNLKDTIFSTTVLSSKLPYWVTGVVKVDSGQVLTIEPGCRFYFQHGTGLEVSGTLEALGDFTNPIVFRGSRIDNLTPSITFDVVPALWSGIAFEQSSQKNRLMNVKISNAISAIRINSNNQDKQVDIELMNCLIGNSSYANIYGTNCSVKATNTIIYNASYSLVALQGRCIGHFIHCTLANYNEFSSLGNLSLFFENIFLKEEQEMSLLFANTIIMGRNQYQIELIESKDKPIEYLFEGCYMPVSISKFDTLNIKRFANNYYMLKKPVFKSTENFQYNFEPDSASFVIGKAQKKYSQQFPTDFYGVSRKNEGATIGAIEGK